VIVVERTIRRDQGDAIEVSLNRGHSVLFDRHVKHSRVDRDVVLNLCHAKDQSQAGHTLADSKRKLDAVNRAPVIQVDFHWDFQSSDHAGGV